MRPSHWRALFAFCLAVSAVSSPADMFEPLFTATRVVGAVKVVRPGGREEPMRADHSYPYGTRILVPSTLGKGETGEPDVWIDLARDFRFRIGPGSDVSVEDASAGERDERSEIKVLDVKAGSVTTFITAVSHKTGGGAADEQVEKNLAAIVIRTPVGQCSRMAQFNEVKVGPDAISGEGSECTFTSQSGVMEITGPQYKITRMKRNTSVSIRGDSLTTAISTVSGEFDAAFEKGADAEERAHFRTGCLAKIWRRFADVGGRMAVAVMLYYPKGNAYEMHSYNYLAGQTNVGMWTSVASAVSGESSALVSPIDAIAATGAEKADGSDAGDWDGSGDWSGDDDADWDDSGDDAGDDSGDDAGDDGFDFGW